MCGTRIATPSIGLEEIRWSPIPRAERGEDSGTSQSRGPGRKTSPGGR